MFLLESIQAVINQNVTDTSSTENLSKDGSNLISHHNQDHSNNRYQ